MDDTLQDSFETLIPVGSGDGIKDSVGNPRGTGYLRYRHAVFSAPSGPQLGRTRIGSHLGSESSIILGGELLWDYELDGYASAAHERSCFTTANCQKDIMLNKPEYDTPRIGGEICG